MHARVRELIAYATQCGFTRDGVDGNGHILLIHPNGARCRIASTPGDYRGDDNARAEMRRLSGVTPPRPNAGRFRHAGRRQGYKMPVPKPRRPDQTGTYQVGEFTTPERERLEAEEQRLTVLWEAAPTGEIEVQLRNIRARIAGGLW